MGLRQTRGYPRLVTAAGSMLLALILVLTGCSSSSNNVESDPANFVIAADDMAALQATSAEAMGNVSSVRFGLQRTGAAVFIDPAAVIAIDEIKGRFTVPGSADAILQVTVNDSLKTQLGAVAIDDEVWLSNPVTGKFETLPPGFDIDPSLFFDPKGGWQPLIAELADLTFVGEEKSPNGATLFRVTGTAPAARMTAITAGLVRDQEVELDLWMIPESGEVARIEFSTVFGDATSDWVLELLDYGETFEIVPPEE